MHTAAIGACRATTSFAKQHARQFAAAVENRSAGVALARTGRQFDQLVRVLETGGEVLSARASDRTIRTAAEARDRQWLADPRGLAYDGEIEMGDTAAPCSNTVDCEAQEAV